MSEFDMLVVLLHHDLDVWLLVILDPFRLKLCTKVKNYMKDLVLLITLWMSKGCCAMDSYLIITPFVGGVEYTTWKPTDSSEHTTKVSL
jgi:hypothetical protein